MRMWAVWVGLDDNRDLGLSGAATAAPIWTEFMKRASTLPAYGDLQEFPVPEGVTALEIDPDTLQLATPACPMTRREVFIRGSEPAEFCERHGGVMLTQTPPASWLSRLFGGDDAEPAEESAAAETPATAAVQPQPTAAPSAPATAAATRPRRPVQARAAPAPKPPEPVPEEKKAGLLERIFGIFGSSRAAQEPAKKSP